MRRAIIVAGMIAALAVSVPAVATVAISLDDVKQALKFSSDEITKLRNGDIVTKDLSETTAAMLAEGLAVTLPAPPEKLAKNVLAATAYDYDPTVLSHGQIDVDAIEQSLAKATFTDTKEIEKLANASPGSEFNLSTEEFAKVKAAVAAGATSAEQLSKVYQEILATRMKAYLSGGIDAIAPYDRGDGDAVSVTDDLKAAAEASTLLQKAAPDLYQTLLDYPKVKADGMKEAFHWIKATVDERPTFALEHRMIYETDTVSIYMARQFFVGHSYDAMQVLAGAFPIEGGSVVVYANRTMTDQVAGFMQGTRHSVGRGMMRDELVEQFKRLRTEFAK